METENSEESVINYREPDPDLQAPTTFQNAQLPQMQSPLFAKLPAEIRATIFELALAGWDDPTRPFDRDSVYFRPGHKAHRRQSTSLLRACQRIYVDAWHVPFVVEPVVVYLCGNAHCPPEVSFKQTYEHFYTAVRTLEARHPAEPIAIRQICFIADAQDLMNAQALQDILDLPNIAPQMITITIRYVDWISWEVDIPPRLNSTWSEIVRFPPSVNALRLEMEYLQREEQYLRKFADVIREHWKFLRDDDVLLVGEEAAHEWSWAGSSSFLGTRWVGREKDEHPEVLHYLVIILTFRPGSKVEYNAQGQPDLRNPQPQVPFSLDDGVVLSGLSLDQLRLHCVPRGVSASEAIRLTREPRP